MNDMKQPQRVKVQEESRILECLNHPNIIRHYNHFKDKNMFHNVVMEYADDGDLAQKINERIE